MNDAALTFPTDASSRLLKGCRVVARDGTPLYTPDGKGHYAALWTRDFAYMIEGAADLFPPGEIEAGLRYLLRHVRHDGAAPDRVEADGTPRYAAGPASAPLGEPNLDNGPFLVIACDTYAKTLPPERAAALWCEWTPALCRALEYVPRSVRGLVNNDPEKPYSPYGFTDTVAKTGELLFESLLYWDACLRMSSRDDGETRAALARWAKMIEDAAAATLWDEKLGAFVAATRDCRQIDLWGMAYAIYIDFPLGPRREKILTFLRDHYDRFVWHGQVRHLLKGEYWQRMLTPVAPETYQNGAYWATASGWLIYALAGFDDALARRTLNDLIDDFKTGGVCECVNEGYRQLPDYVASATNPRATLRRMADR